MLKRPKFKNQLHVETVENEGIFLLSEKGTFLLDNYIYQTLYSFLNGNYTVEQVIEQLQDELPAAYIYYALMELEHQGYLVENEEVFPHDLSLLIENLNVNLKEAKHSLKNKSVKIKVLGRLSPSNLMEIFESLQIQVAEKADADFEVILTEDYLHPELIEINRENQKRSRPWMLVKPIGTTPWIGPIFHTPQTGCWECLAQRLQGNRPIERFIQARRNTLSSHPITPPLTHLPAIQKTALVMAAMEIFKWIIQGNNTSLKGLLITYDTLNLEIRKHSLIKRPQCSCCGILELQHRQPLPIVLGNRWKKFTSDGGHRCLSPEETFDHYKQHISPVTGVVRDLGRLSHPSQDLTPSYFAKHHFASVFDDLRSLQQNLGGRSAGKGRTDAQARASAFCEAIERYSGVFQGDEYRIQGSYEKLGDRAIHPNQCMNFSEKQYLNRKEWNKQCSSFFQIVPAPFDETQEIDWTPLWSLTQQEFKYLPTAYCYFGYPSPSEPDCWADTNGCAAGNTLEEAILQGFMELVERDSVALWWYNQVARPRVDLESFDEPYFQDLVNYYRSINREIWVLDITSDLQIPTFAAISRRCDRAVEDILLGFGAHFDPQLAVQRAMTEVNQLLPSVLSAKEDGTTQYATSADQSVIHWWKTATLANQPYLVPLSQIPPKIYDDYSPIHHENLLDDLKLCQQIVEQKGLEMLVLDQTRPDIGLRVVKVVVPGMRHFWNRLAPGRLYEVPVQMGWVEKALTEDKVNPIPIWL